MRPTSFLGGLFIGRDCHTMGDHSVIWCAALVGKVSLAHYTTYKEAWTLSRKVRKTLNREGIVPAADVLAFRANTSAMVVAYLLNIRILGPVAPLTGQYSRGGLN